MEPIKSAAVLVYRKSEQNETEILLVRHGKSATHLTDTYGLPAGRLEEGEDEHDCAQRELEEETGLITKKAQLKITPTRYNAEIERKDGKKLFTMRTFVCLESRGNLISTPETSPEWVEINKLDKYNLLVNVKEAVLEGLKLI